MASNDANRVLTFEVYQGTALIKRADFTEASITIGSGDSALLQVEHGELAELHAVVNVESDGSVSLLDLGSDAGLTLNGEKISNASLQSGDTFEVADLKFVISTEAANVAGRDLCGSVHGCSSPDGRRGVRGRAGGCCRLHGRRDRRRCRRCR